MNQSPLAVVHPEAKIGQNVTIDPFAVIEKDVVIGDNCHIYSHAVILDGARIGDNCSIFPGAVIAGIPQDLKFKGEQTTAEIGKNTTIRECVTINRGTASKGKTIVGSDCLISTLLFVDRTSYDTAFGSLDKVEYQVSFFAGFVFGLDSLDGFRIIQATGI